ncbi:hypothetical protein AciM339_0751 [Aciduliprofundum sp. MAR08-339]|uniref:hypothetical protein n=1 Tax=Aciduliprofundum sp. (strain MAR08-339) TaxID=673860 RepID=UPI0002A4A8D8|nr:hypothetical protein AciM339_0751 [Aciduliprofundum sp. MAR08-339]
MKREEAIRRIDNLVNVLAVEIPDEIEIYGRVYSLKEDISSPEENTIIKYQSLYKQIMEDIHSMEDVPEEIVQKAIILRRIVLFLKEYEHSGDIEDKKRWINFVKRMK